LYFPIGTTPADVKSAIADLRIFAGRVTDVSEQSISNKSLALVDGVVVPKLQGHGTTTRGEQGDGAVPQRQAFEQWRIVESDVERQNCRPGKANPSVLVIRALLLCEAGMLECNSLLFGHRFPSKGWSVSQIRKPDGDPKLPRVSILIRFALTFRSTTQFSR
jgi:hypothetical protein